MSDVVIGHKVSAKRLCFMIDKDNKRLHCAYFPTIEINGTMMMVKDANAPAGKLEAETRYKAIKKGKEALERIRNNS